MNFLLKVTVLAFIISVTTAVELHNLPQLIKVSEPVAIYPKQQERSLFTNLGILSPIRQCGGSGRLIRWRNEACPLHTSGACVYPANHYYRGEVTFVPSESSESLGVRVLLKDPVSGAVLTAFQNEDLEKSGVEAGKEFALSGRVAVVPELRGRTVTNQLTVYRESDKEVEVCAEADFLIV